MTPESLRQKVYLTTAEAACYLGYTPETHKNPARSFHDYVVRHGIPRSYLGRRLRFFRRDLDAALRRSA